LIHLLVPVPVVASTPISVSIPTLVIELLIFLGMVGLMERLVFTPIRQAWRERDAAIQAGLEASTLTRDEAEEARAEVNRILRQARQHAQAAIDAAIAEGDKVRAAKIAEATEEFQRLVTEARIEIQAEQAQAAAQLRQWVVDLALEAAARVSGQSYDDPEVRELAAAVVGREGWS
jgi:F-type H+-transporting ATPase subunit b